MPPTKTTVLDNNTAVSVGLLVLLMGIAGWAFTTSGKADTAVASTVELKASDEKLREHAETCRARLQRVEDAQTHYAEQQKKIDSTLMRLEEKLDKLKERRP